MLAFVTSLRHPQNSEDYPRVEALLAKTLRSVTSQSVDDYVVIVVGNVRPSFELPERVHYVPVDFGPPAPPDGPRTAREPFVRDKGSKIGIGLVYAQRFAPDFVMIFDADDFVHRSLVEFTAGSPDQIGWYVDRGYVLSRSRGTYRRQNGFNKTCGTCMVVSASAYDVPSSLSVTSTQDEVVEAFGETLPRVLGAHREGVEWFRSRGVHLMPLPFRAAIYHVDTGENHSGKQLEGLARPVGRRFASTFGLTSPAPSLRSVRQGVGPLALAQSVSSLAGRVVAILRRLRPSR